MPTIHDKYTAELYRIIAEHDLKAVAGGELLPLKREMNRLLSEALFRHKRELDLAAGLPVEPIAHFAECILLPVAGFGDK